MALDSERQAEIDAQREAWAHTRRATVPALEEILYKPLKVLDHGFIRVIDYMGDDAAIVQAARVSYGKGTKQVSNDKGLISYLLRNRHTSPFEMCEIKLHVKMPIFVARQWIRHRTANVNEYSARYSILDREFYIPDRAYLDTTRQARKLEKKSRRPQDDLFGFDAAEEARRLQEEAGLALQHTTAQSRTNKQGREDAVVADEAAEAVELITKSTDRDYRTYSKLLNEDAGGRVLDPERQGIARELARMVLPLNTYTQMYWKIDLHNLLHFLRLRYDPHAQYEIRAYAETLFEKVVLPWVPITAAAFQEYRMAGRELSSTAIDLVRRRLRGETVDPKEAGMSQREWRELLALMPELADE
jgi:thymidylate synthase (FAD)